MSALPTRRAVLSATALLGTVAAVPAVAQPLSDAALLAACRDFRRAHADQLALEDEGYTEGAGEKISARWFGALQAALDAPTPRTTEGLVALAGIAWMALLEQASCGRGVTGLAGWGASTQERVALKALAAVGGVA